MGLKGRGLELQEFSDCPRPSKIIRPWICEKLFYTLSFKSLNVWYNLCLRFIASFDQKYSPKQE